MYIPINKDDKVKKEVGTLFLKVISVESAGVAEVRLLLGRTDKDMWSSYRVATVALKNERKGYSIYTYVNEDALKSIVRDFYNNPFTMLDECDVDEFKVFSGSYYKIPFQTKAINIEDMKNWYLKNRLMNQNLPNINFMENSLKSDLKRITENDLVVGKLYVTKANSLFLYLGKYSDKYNFYNMYYNLSTSKEIIIEFGMILRGNYRVKQTKSLPCLYALDTYPLNLLSEDLIRQKDMWYHKTYQINFVSAYEFKCDKDIIPVCYIDSFAIDDAVFKYSCMDELRHNKYYVTEKPVSNCKVQVTLRPTNVHVATLYIGER